MNPPAAIQGERSVETVSSADLGVPMGVVDPREAMSSISVLAARGGAGRERLAMIRARRARRDVVSTPGLLDGLDDDADARAVVQAWQDESLARLADCD